ncbi:MAG: tRNA lysidine(34) synthetase TilS [Planctomycetota bacterium]|nr:MAG: tRNA lysidine(34) synthetase TilS [Planctomycetota bacterium]
MDERTFHHRLYESARRLIPPHAAVVCAVSGGADSVALLCGLEKVNEIHACRWRLSVGHVDHRLRPESGEDARFVEGLCASLGVSCSVKSADVRHAARERGESIETAARHCRHALLAECARAAGASVIAMAHHADDQAETILHRILRGTGLRGLSGMAAARPLPAARDLRLVRPLLVFSREALRAYLTARGIGWREDASNGQSDAATRNRIRHDLLPVARSEVNPRVTEALVQLGEQARQAGDALRRFAVESWAEVAEPAGDEAASFRVRARALAMLPRAIQAECMLLALESLGAGMGEIGHERVEALVDLAGGDGTRRRIELPGGVFAERRGDVITIGKESDAGVALGRSGKGAEVADP